MWWSLRTWKVAHRKFVALPNWVRWWFSSYPLVNIQKAIEHGHRNSEFSHEKWWFSSCKMVIFHSFLYVYQRVHVYKRGFRQGDAVHKIGWIRLGHPGLLAGLHQKKTCPMAKDIEFLNIVREYQQYRVFSKSNQKVSPHLLAVACPSHLHWGIQWF